MKEHKRGPFAHPRRRSGVIFKRANRERSGNASERKDPHRRDSSQQNYGKQNQGKTKRNIINNSESGTFVGANTARMHESWATMRLRAVTAGKREQGMQSSPEFICIGVCPLALCGEIPPPVQEALFLRVRSKKAQRNEHCMASCQIQIQSIAISLGETERGEGEDGTEGEPVWVYVGVEGEGGGREERVETRCPKRKHASILRGLFKIKSFIASCLLPGEERLSVPKVSCHERPSAAATQGIGAGGGVDRSLAHPHLLHPDRRGLEELPAPLLAQDVEATHAYVRGGAV